MNFTVDRVIPPDRSSGTRNNSRQPVSIVLLAIFLLGTAAVIIGGIGTGGYKISAALIWGFGFCVSGMLLGFLFAIPRVLPAGTVVAPPVKQGADASAPPAQAAVVNAPSNGQSEINSNLVEVSDWLTKIIVGVGLVELKNLPMAAESVAIFVAPSLGYATGKGAPVVGGIMLFFSVHGFLIGYLLTRIYLAMILKWADNQVISQRPKFELDSGDTIDVDDMLTQLQERIGDVQKTVAEKIASEPEPLELAAMAPAAAAPTDKARILWVDDILNDTKLLVDSLKKSDIVIDQALTTDEAMQMLEGSRTRYDLVITDMHRRESQGAVPNAGILLTQAIKDKMPDLPVLVYCSPLHERAFGPAALNAGARMVTTSSTRLFGEVTKILKAAGKSA